MQDEDLAILVTYLSKNEFKEHGYIRSRKYYLPFAPNLTLMAKRSGLLTSLITKSFRDPCGATIPMLKYESPHISDISPMRIQNWDNSVIVLNGGYPVAVKCPTNISNDWLTTEIEGEKFILSLSKNEEAGIQWGTLTVPNLYEYVKNSLYFKSHLDNDQILQSLSKVYVSHIISSEELANKFEKLGKAKTVKTSVGAKSDPSQEENTPMEVTDSS